MQKKLISVKRKRKIPARFSWLDHRLIKHHAFQQSSPGAMKLYCFLVTVGDADGISYYGISSLSVAVKMELSDIVKYRKELELLDLVAYEKPFYQVLDLANPTPEEKINCHNTFAQIAKEVANEKKSIWREGNEPKNEPKSIKDIIANL